MTEHTIASSVEGTPTTWPDGMLLDFFDRQVERTPDTVAVTDKTASLTYRDLSRAADEIASSLARRGLGPEDLVGVYMTRTRYMVAALIGILRTGCAYVPLDPSYPPSRISYIVADAGLETVISDAPLGTAFPESTQVLRPDFGALGNCALTPSAKRPEPHNLAYVMYTSGSTGAPKGVAIEHRSVHIFLKWAIDTFCQDELAGVLAGTSICFDISVLELFGPLSVGGTIILATNVLDLPTLPDAERVTLLHSVPSAIAELVRADAIPASVRTVAMGGEPLSGKLAQSVYRNTNATKVYNLYGPTEDTIWSSYALVQRGATTEPPIGTPIYDTTAYVLDAALKPVPPGHIGELYLAGRGLARGYYRRPDLTAERFVSNPDSPNRDPRMYRTGDLARIINSSVLEFVGRTDRQVKLRGYRIELDEIESVLKSLAKVDDAAVFVDDSTEQRRLVAHFVADDTITATILRGALANVLPTYMIPAGFVRHQTLPRTPNGKLDRKALAAHKPADAINSTASYSAERLQTVIAGILSTALDGDPFAPDDDFFEQGGDSLAAARAIARIRQEFGVDIPLTALLDRPTSRELAEFVQRALASTSRPSPPAIATSGRRE